MGETSRDVIIFPFNYCNTGFNILSHVPSVIWFLSKVLGSCKVFEERQVGNERFNIFSGCPSGQTATIVLRGGADQVCCYE